MNETTWERLVWKEHRLLRGFWVATVVLCALALYAMTWQLRYNDDPTAFFQVAMGIGACYALGCGAVAFAGEREARTDLFQSSLPTNGRRLLIAKSSHAAVTTIAMLIVLWLLAWGAIGIWQGEFGGLAHLGVEPALLGLIAALQLLAWSLLLSLRSSSPLRVVIWAFVCNAITTYPIAWFFERIPDELRTAWYFPSLLGDLSSAVPRLVLVTAVSYGCWRWASHWTRGETDRRRSTAGSWQFVDRMSAAFWSRFDAWPQWQRLMWQQWRSARMYLLAIASVYGVLFLYGQIVDPNPGIDEWTVPYFIACGLFGTAVFHFDQRLQRARFLTEHGVAPGTLWWARQSFWFGLFAGFSLIVALSANAAQGTDWLVSDIPAKSIPLYLVFAVSCYGVGQWTSLWIRIPVLRVMVTAVFCLPILGWCNVIRELQVPWWWSTGPIPLLFLVASRFGLPDWMRGRTGKRTWLIQLSKLALPCVAILFGFIAFRWTEIPQAHLAFTTSPRSEFDRAAAMAKGVEYLQVAFPYDPLGESGLPYDRQYNDASFSNGIDPAECEVTWLSDEQKTWLASHDDQIRRVLAIEPDLYMLSAEALANQSWRKTIPPNVGSLETNELRAFFVAHQQIFTLQLVLIKSGLKCQQEGDLREALRRYTAALNLILKRQIDDRSVPFGYDSHYYYLVMRHLQSWAAESGQSAELIRQAFHEAGRPVDWVDQFEQYLKYEHRLSRDATNGDSQATQEFLDRYGLSTRPAKFQRCFRIYRYLPWERWRALRLVDTTLAPPLQTLEAVRVALQSNTPYQAPTGEEFSELRDVGPTFLIVDPMRSFLGNARQELDRMTTNQRVTLIILALQGWALEHGSLPETLEQLTPTWFEALPIDPVTARPFQYFPKGVDQELRWEEPYRLAKFVLPPGRPFLFAPRPEENAAELPIWRNDSDLSPCWIYAIPVRKTEP
jgi:hypothetical protein